MTTDPRQGIIDLMDEFDYYDDDPYERHDDYNVFEEREIMNDREWDHLDYEDPADEYEQEPVEDFGYFGEMGLWD